MSPPTDRDTLAHYLAETGRRGRAVRGRFQRRRRRRALRRPGPDLARRSTTAAIAAVSFDAEGCATARAAAAATAELAEGERGARRGRDRRRPTIAAQLGGLGPQGRHAAELAADALHRALGGAAGSGLRLAGAPAAGERVLVALSGGVDSAVAALRERERGAEVVAVTLKLWADPRTDAAQELLLAGRRARRPGARALARDPAPDPRPRGRVSRARRRRVRRRVPRRVDAEPVRALQRGAADRRDDRARRAPRLRRARHRPLRAARRRRRGPAARRAPPTRRRTRPTCSPACARTRSRGCASRSPS